jgi:thiol-disulfide isomerase/thioredoxin
MSKAEKSKYQSKTENIDKDIENKDQFYVLFYATWCPFSRRFLPVYEEFMQTQPENCSSIIVDDRADLCDKYEIEYYPTVILFRKGKVSKRLDAEPGVGLSKKQLTEFTENT